jgi:ADP-heptose:LPS heptosyltransferase
MPGQRRTFFSGIPLRSVCETEVRSRRGRQAGFNARAVARRIGRCDLFLSLNSWRSASLDRLAALLSPAMSVGFSPAFRVGMAKRLTQHITDEAFRVPAYLDPSLQLSDFAFPPSLPSRVGPLIRQFLRAVAPGKRVLAVHSETKLHKRWAPDRLSKVLVAFLERHPEFVIFVLDFHKPKLKMTKFKDRIIHSRGLPLPYAFGALKESDLFLGVDSCMLHAADLFRIPGVGLFGPTDPRRYGFLFAPHRHVHDSRGMEFISESAVLKALESLLL